MTNANFRLTDNTAIDSATAVSGVVSDDGFLTLSQSLGGPHSDVVVLSPAMVRELVQRLGTSQSSIRLAA